MVKRFAERLDLWVREAAEAREDKFVGWLLFAAVALIGSDAYTFFSVHRGSSSGLFGTVLFVGFVILYLRQARCAWIVLAVLAARCLVYVPFEYFRAASRSGVGAGLFTAAFLLVITSVAFVFSLVIRKRFANSTRII